MKLELSKGCADDVIKINGIYVEDYDDAELQDIASEVAEQMDREDITHMLMSYIERNGKETYSHKCDACGDYDTDYELNI